MPATETPKTRRRKQRTDDGKGDRRMIAGKRFRTPSATGLEADKRFERIDDVWRDNETFCRKKLKKEPHWNHIALWAAESIRKGVMRVPLPPIDDILPTFDEADCDWPQMLKMIIGRHTDEEYVSHYTPTVDGLAAEEAISIYEIVSDAFPSVNWVLPKPHAEAHVKGREQNARWSLEQLAKAKNNAPPDPKTPLIAGTFHESLSAYEEKRRADFTEPDGTFDGSGHHFLGIIRAVRERRSDFQLAELDYRRCQEEYDYWRDRPEDRRKNKKGNYLTRKTCQNYIGELGRFFDWLHLTSKFGWRKPEDFSSLKRKVRTLKTDRRSVQEMEIKTFSIEDLKLLYRHAIPSERFLMAWCLNCAHGAAEMGRVEWADLFLRQEHPWKNQGLKVDSSSEDSWCGFTRPKSDVLGWWLLWPETVQLLEWWRSECQSHRRREPRPNERLLLTNTGSPLYRDESRNAQSGFSNAWRRLRKRIENEEPEVTIPKLPFGTLRNQLSDWLGGDQAKALVASVALCHGIPHQGDKLLYRHYANRPWAALFQSQREYRDYLRPMFDAVSDPLAEPDPTGDKVRVLWETGIRSVKRIAECLELSEAIVQRRVQKLGLRAGSKDSL